MCELFRVHFNSDFLDYWVDTYASFNLHYSTTVAYINIIKNHVKPRIGYYQLWQLDTRLLQEFINQIYVEYSFSKNYMASILKVVKGSLKYACYTLNYINSNPAEHVHAPRIEKIETDPAHIFTQEEFEKILKQLKEENYCCNTEKNHSSIIKYEYYQVEDVIWLYNYKKWRNLKSIGRVKRLLVIL